MKHYKSIAAFGKRGRKLQWYTFSHWKRIEVLGGEKIMGRATGVMVVDRQHWPSSIRYIGYCME